MTLKDARGNDGFYNFFREDPINVIIRRSNAYSRDVHALTVFHSMFSPVFHPPQFYAIFINYKDLGNTFYTASQMALRETFARDITRNAAHDVSGGI